MEAFLSVFHLSVIQGKGQKKVKNKIDFKVTLIFFCLFFSSLLFSFLIVNSTRPQFNVRTLELTVMVGGGSIRPYCKMDGQSS